MLIVLVALALSASADPDPPAVDGGNVTFNGDWTVDPGDHLVYVNQTIQVNGNVTISPSSTLDLVNCTLYLNATPPTEEPRGGLRVGTMGGLNVTNGSLVMALFLDYFIVDPGAHLLVEDSEVAGIGHTAPLSRSGLYVQADDTTIRRSAIRMGNHGLLIDGATGCTLENVSFIGPQRNGLYLLGGSSGLVLRNLTFTGQMVAVSIVDCLDIDMSVIDIQSASYGISLARASVNVSNAVVGDLYAEAVSYSEWGAIQWSCDGSSRLYNTTLLLNGSLEVLSRGSFEMVNSTLVIDNPAANGTNSIRVWSGGAMSVHSGSTVSSAAGGHAYGWTVEPAARLFLDDVTVSGAGWDDANPGLVVHSSGNHLSDVDLSACYAGLTVAGDVNSASHITATDCWTGVAWSGNDSDLVDLTFEACRDIGLHLEGASNVSVSVGGFNMSSGASAAVRMVDCDLVTLSDIVVNRSTSPALDLLRCDDVRVVDAVLSANGTAVVMDGGGAHGNITLERVSIPGVDRGAILSGLTGVSLYHVSLTFSTSGITGTDTGSLELRDCTLDGGDADNAPLSLTNCTGASVLESRFNGTGTQLEAWDCGNLTVGGCLFIEGDEALILHDCTGPGLTNLTVVGMEDGMRLLDCVNATVWDSLVTDVTTMGGLAMLRSSGAEVVNLTVVNAPAAVVVTGGSHVHISRMSVVNVSTALYVEGVALNISISDSRLEDVPVAVRATMGAEVTLLRCSLVDCPFGISGDESSNVTFETDGASEIVNGTCRLRGRFLVGAQGSLNLSGVSVVLLGANVSDSLVRAELGSTLRLLEGTSIEAHGTPFCVTAAGDLEARDVLISGGGNRREGYAALAADGAAAVIVNVTFEGCDLALSLSGTDPRVRRCDFTGNNQSMLLRGVQRLVVSECSFSGSMASWDLQGNFTTNLQVTECVFEGGGTVPMALRLQSAPSSKAALVLRNVTMANYTVWGVEDDHHGNLQMTGCVLESANASLGRWTTDFVTVTGVNVSGCRMEVGSAGFLVSDCTFINASFGVSDNSGGSLVTDCSFQGAMAPGEPSLEVDGSIRVTLTDLRLVDVAIGLRVSGSSELTVSSLSLDGASGTALEVNGSIVRLEGTSLGSLHATGVRVWSAGSRVEFRNGTISASAGRTGHDVDARGGGDAWLLNTTLDRNSVASTGAGRVEVLWHVTVEPVLPWGGVLWDPDHLAVTDAMGTEVVNVSTALGVLRLYEFSEEDGVRTPMTPHTFHVSDHQAGVSYQGARTINASSHLFLDLVDVANPAARAGQDKVVNEDQKVTFDATTSSDNDPTFRTTGTFRWEFEEYGIPVTLNGDVVSYVFSVPGKYWVNLTVRDLAGNTGLDTVIIQVKDVTAPVIRYGGNVTVDEDTWHIFDASATTDNDPTFDFTTGTFLWRIDLGPEVLERDTASFGSSFPEPGNYTGTLSVWDNAGNRATASFWVAVLDTTAPVIGGLSNATIFEPADGLLDASGCMDNVGIVTYRWTVLYNNWTGGFDEEVELSGVAPTYHFDLLGTFSVSLDLWDAAGNHNSTELSVVYDDPPVISVPSWLVSMAGESIEVPIYVHDVYYRDLTVSVVGGDGGPVVEGPSTGARLVWTPGDDDAGEDVSITLQVHDGFVSSRATVTVHVNPARGASNNPPVIGSEPPRASKRATPYIYPVSAEDPDGDVLGYVLEEGPEGMSVSPGGTVSWDPPFDQGTELVDVHLSVTDGRDSVHQTWTIRWREPPNAAPIITFIIEPVEVRVREEFLVDLSVYIQDPESYDLDADDPNNRLEWSVEYDDTMVTLVSRSGLVFTFHAMDERGSSAIAFKATDPSGASDSTSLDMVVKKGQQAPPDDGTPWTPWLALALLLAVGIAGGAVAVRRRGRHHAIEGPPGPDEEEAPDLGPPPEERPEASAAIEAALVTQEDVEVSSFVELEGRRPRTLEAPVTVATPPVSRVIGADAAPPGKPFAVEGVAVLEANGSVLASTGTVEDLVGPYSESVEGVRRGLRGDGLAVLELGGHRVLLALRSGLGAMCVIRGHEDDAFRSGLRDHLSELFKDRSREGAVGVVEDILASAGPADTAEVVRDAWTTRLETTLTYQGSLVLLDTRLRNDTDHILNNVRLRLHHDEDALSVQSITPKLLTSHGRMSLGNVPPRKEHKVAISLVPETCMSSNVRMVATYTDMEGRTVHVPTPTLPVAVECPHIEPGSDIDEEGLASLSERGLGFSGRRVFDHGMDVDYKELYSVAVGLVSEQGPMKVMDLDDDSLMRSEAWFLGSGEGGSPRVLVRVSCHGADHMLELFVTSDDGQVATGLLTHLAGELMDAAASRMPGKRVERVRDGPTLEEISVWPTLLDYRIMGE
jgi:hypothetical protein